jgi:hypothetical protein
MAYQKTGRPPGRPRKYPRPDEAPSAVPAPASAKKVLKRAHKHFRRAAGEPDAALHSPPRYLRPRHERQVGARPVLHPHVIKGG